MIGVRRKDSGWAYPGRPAQVRKPAAVRDEAGGAGEGTARHPRRNVVS
jgi:hypothetical protein